MNSLRVIHPYLSNGVLVFDDPVVGLEREPFVQKSDIALMAAARQAGANPEHFTLLFADGPFPGHQARAEWIEAGQSGYGDWYRVTLPEVGAMDCWLCPALLKYFTEAPARIFFQIKPFERTVP